MSRASIVLAVMLALSVPAWAARPVTIHEGFLLTGQGYLGLSEVEKSAYAMGIIDGMLLAPLFGAPDDGKVSKLGRCATGMTNEQVAAIIAKLIKEHPEEWHMPIHLQVFKKLHSICGLAG